MSAQLQVVGEAGDIMSPADLAHTKLRRALERIVDDYWAVADAMHAAHESEAWLRDDRGHEARYRRIMAEQNLNSIFQAYCLDEFGLRAAYSGYVDVAGRLRSAVDNPSTMVEGIDWSRFALRSIRPISATIVDTYEASDVAAALVKAQQLASKDAVEHPKAGHGDDVDNAPVLGRHVRAALVEHGLIPPRAPGLDELEASERRAAKITTAQRRLGESVDYLLGERQRKAVIDIVIAAIKRLGDQPTALAKIRAVLDEVTPT